MSSDIWSCIGSAGGGILRSVSVLQGLSVKTAASRRSKKPKNTSLIMKLCHFHIHLRVTALSACLEVLLGFSLEGSLSDSSRRFAALVLATGANQPENSNAGEQPQMSDSCQCFLLILMKRLILRGLLSGGGRIHFFISSECPQWASAS